MPPHKTSTIRFHFLFAGFVLVSIGFNDLRFTFYIILLLYEIARFLRPLLPALATVARFFVLYVENLNRIICMQSCRCYFFFFFFILRVYVFDLCMCR